MVPEPGTRRSRGRRDIDDGSEISRKPGRAREPPRRLKRAPEEEPSPSGPPKRYVLWIALIVGALIVGAIVLVIALNSDTSIGTIYIGNIEARDMDDDLYNDNFPETLYIPFIADAKGFGSAKGDVTLTVTYGDDPTVLHTEKVRISGDMGDTFLPLNKFVQGNGKYVLTATAGGSSSSSDYYVYTVTEKLVVTWNGAVNDVPLYSHSYTVSYTVTPKDKEGRALPMAPMPYSVRGSITKPDGGDLSLDKTWGFGSTISLTGSVEHTMKGTYAMDLEWTNLMCASSSPYYKVKVVQNETYGVDAPPYADAGEDQTVQLSGGEATVSFDATGSADDGNIVEYRWDFGDDTNVVTTTPYATHTYTTAGEYYVTLIVVDDSGHLSKDRWGGKPIVTVNS